MATFDDIRQEINSSIYENQDGDITGEVMNEVLNDMVDAVEEAVTDGNLIRAFKGWWPDLATLKAAVTAEPGDSAYVKDASPATTWSIYTYSASASSDNYWADSGTDADTSNVQTFASGEEVNEVHIVNDLNTGGEHDVLSANQGNKLLNTMLKDAIKSDRILRNSYLSNSKILEDGTIGTQTNNRVAIYNLSEENYNSLAIEITGYKRSADISGLLYGFYDSNDNYISGSGSGQGTTGVMTMFCISIPSNATTLKVSYYVGTNSYLDYVYFYTPDNKFSSGQILSNVNIDNNFDGGDDNVMSAENGKLIFSHLNDFCTSEYIPRPSGVEYSQILSDGTIGTTTNINNRVYTYPLTTSDFLKLYIQGYKRADNQTGLLYGFYDSNNNYIVGSGWGNGYTGNLEHYVIIDKIPSNTAYIKIGAYNGSSDNNSSSLYILRGNNKTIKTIIPYLERGVYNINGDTPTDAYIKNKRCGNYIKVDSNSSYIFNSSISCYLRLYQYRSDYSLISYTDINLVSETDYNFSTGGCSYIKFNVGINSAIDYNSIVPNFTLKITGAFSDNWEVKNVRSSTGYTHLFIPVYPIDATASDNETNAVQDESTLTHDDGLIALPESYTNDGNPTRLIIYCHGAGVNYSKTTNTFPSSDLLPEYWLSEGYAVMDMDGECAADTGKQHGYVPESLQCYLNAYKYVLRNYNICKDGIFVGGRSMGGGMSISLCNCNQIPVIACCPVVPVLNTIWWWEYMSADRRTYVAQGLGFENIPESWSSDPMTTEQYAYLKSNFEKLVKYSPLWKCIVDLPDKDTLFGENNKFNISSSTITGNAVQDEYDLYSTLHAQVKCPIKIFDNYSDTTVPYERNARIFYQMLINAGNSCELRMFDVSGDTDTSISTHHFELRSDRMLPIYTNSFGVVLNNVPVVYVEMLKFWQRFEQ